MNEKHQKELLLLAEGLIKRGIQFQFRNLYDGGQIIVYEKLNLPYCEQDELIREWDAVCHSGSYGHNEGLLEIMGVLVDSSKHEDSVEGFLTAEEILSRIDRRYNNEGNK